MTTWIVTTTPDAAALVALGDAHGPAVLVPVVPPAGVPVEAVAPGVAEWVVDAVGVGDLVLVPNRPAERVMGAAIAVRWGVPVVAGAVGVRDGVVETRRHGGILVEEVRIGPGLIAIGEGGGPVDLPPGQRFAAGHRLRVVAERPDDGRSVDLATARRIVAVGRGAMGVPDAAVRALAEVLGAEVGWSRPAAEAAGERLGYVGVSGIHVRPELYVALGISGQLQHLAGVDADMVVAVNTDPAAPIWAHADIGVVGDAAGVVGGLLEALGDRGGALGSASTLGG